MLNARQTDRQDRPTAPKCCGYLEQRRARSWLNAANIRTVPARMGFNRIRMDLTYKAEFSCTGGVFLGPSHLARAVRKSSIRQLHVPVRVLLYRYTSAGRRGRLSFFLYTGIGLFAGSKKLGPRRGGMVQAFIALHEQDVFLLTVCTRASIRRDTRTGAA